jgi:hypothetical protein
LNQEEKELSREEKGTTDAGNAVIRAHVGAAPFGFDVLGGQLIEHPRELRAVQRIIDLWNSGRGQKDIATELNRLKILTRKGKQWDHSVVGEVVRRAHNRVAPYDRFAKNMRPFLPRNSPGQGKKLKKKNESQNQNNL